MDEGAWERAALAFDAATSRDGAAELVWNAARAWDKAEGWTEARDRYVRFLAVPGAPEDLRAFAARRVEDLNDEIEASLHRRRGLDEAQVASLLADELRADFARAEPAEAPVEPAFAERPAPTARADAPHDPGDEGLRVAGWIGIGVGLAGVAAGTVMLAEAARFDGELARAERDADGVIVGMTAREAAALTGRRDDAARFGVAGLAIGGAVAVAGVALVLADATSDAEAPEAPLSIDLVPRPGGGVLVTGSAF